MKHTSDEINEKFQSAPALVQDKLSSDELPKKVQEMGRKYGLHIDQQGVLNDEIMYVILGIEPAQFFVKNVMSRVHLAEAEAKELAKEINRSIFTPLREELKERPPNAPNPEPESTPEDDEVPHEELENVDFGSMERQLPDSVFTRDTLPKESDLDTFLNAEPNAKETTTPEKSRPSIEERRLTEEVVAPKQERTVSEIREKLPQTEAANTESATDSAPTKNYPGSDPYREPVS